MVVCTVTLVALLPSCGVHDGLQVQGVRPSDGGAASPVVPGACSGERTRCSAPAAAPIDLGPEVTCKMASAGRG
jgi:hypothetical protein